MDTLGKSKWRTKKMLALYRWIRDSRLARGLSKQALSRMTGLNPNSITKIDVAIRRIDIWEYVLLCKALQVAPNEGLGIIDGRLKRDKHKTFPPSASSSASSPSVKKARPDLPAKIISRLDTTHMTPNQIAQAAGCTPDKAQIILHQLGKPFIKGKAYGNIKYEWAKVDWSKTDEEIAKELGLKRVCYVFQYGQRHGHRNPGLRFYIRRDIPQRYRNQEEFHFLAWLRAERLASALTFNDVRTKTALLWDRIGKIESGKRRMDPAEYVRLCKVIGANPFEGLAILRGSGPGRDGIKSEMAV